MCLIFILHQWVLPLPSAILHLSLSVYFLYSVHIMLFATGSLFHEARCPTDVVSDCAISYLCRVC